MAFKDDLMANQFAHDLRALIISYGIDTTPIDNNLAAFTKDFLQFVATSDPVVMLDVVKILKNNMPVDKWTIFKERIYNYKTLIVASLLANIE